MPLLLDKSVSENSRIALWRITESAGTLMTLLNCPIDPVLLDVNEQFKKQRISARILLNLIGPLPCNEVAYDQFNKPFLIHSAHKISISHSNEMVGVIVSKNSETGIDIELISTRIERIADRFMSGPELKSVEESRRTEQLITYWCAKESLYKYYGKKDLSFKEQLLIEPFVAGDEGSLRGHIRTGSFNFALTLRYEKIGEYMLVYVNDMV
jgi:4'-phosphopantetheinyl transferase